MTPPELKAAVNRILQETDRNNEGGLTHPLDVFFTVNGGLALRKLFESSRLFVSVGISAKSSKQGFQQHFAVANLPRWLLQRFLCPVYSKHWCVIDLMKWHPFGPIKTRKRTLTEAWGFVQRHWGVKGSTHMCGVENAGDADAWEFLTFYCRPDFVTYQKYRGVYLLSSWHGFNQISQHP